MRYRCSAPQNVGGRRAAVSEARRHALGAVVEPDQTFAVFETDPSAQPQERRRLNEPRPLQLR